MQSVEDKVIPFAYSSERFLELTKDALEHFYDLTHLQNHPFAQRVRRDDGTHETRGQRLQKDLARTVDLLDYSQPSAAGSGSMRRYNVMRLRYVDQLTIQRIAHELSISERQIHRDLRHAEEDLATILWSWYVEEAESAADEPEPGEPVYPELDHLQTNLQTVDIRRLVLAGRSSIEGLLAKRQVDIAIDVPPEPVMVSTDPVIAKHVFIHLFSVTAQKSEGDVVCVTLEAGDDTSVLHVSFNQRPAGDDSLLNDITVQLIHRLKWDIRHDVLQGARRHVQISFGNNMPTVLVIDDFEGLSRLLKRYLAGYQCRVLAATDGMSGLSLAREVQPDAVILDVMMPDVDGWEVLQRFQNHPDTRHIPVIICSVFNDPELAHALGAASFLSKPVKREDIIRALRSEHLL